MHVGASVARQAGRHDLVHTLVHIKILLCALEEGTVQGAGAKYLYPCDKGGNGCVKERDDEGIKI